MNCDMCGKEAELYRTRIEGTEMNLCKPCSQYGEAISKIEPQQTAKPKTKPSITLPEKEIIQIIVPNYAKIIKEKREQLGLKQEEFAKKIAEKESVIHKIETGQFEPPMVLARKIERFLKVHLIEQHEEVPQKTKRSAAEGFTIGDVLRIK